MLYLLHNLTDATEGLRFLPPFFFNLHFNFVRIKISRSKKCICKKCILLVASKCETQKIEFSFVQNVWNIYLMTAELKRYYYRWMVQWTSWAQLKMEGRWVPWWACLVRSTAGRLLLVWRVLSLCLFLLHTLWVNKLCKNTVDTVV